MIRFFVHGVPQTQGNLRGRPTKAGFAVLYETNKKVPGWKQVIAQAAQPLAHMHTGGVAIEMTFYLPRPKKFPKNKSTEHTKRPDVDKLERAILDSLTGVMFTDDAQVCTVFKHKRYADDGGRIGVDIVIGAYEELATPGLRWAEESA